MTKIEPGKSTLNLEELMLLLPHRYPILLIDRLVEIKPGDSAVGIKNISYSDPVFQGHFPEKPIWPGVFMIEAMAQAAAAFTAYTEELNVDGKIILFMGVEKAKFRRPVVPGDQLRIAVRTVQRRMPVWRFAGVAEVDGKKVAEAEYSAMLADAQ
ncbi:MAG: 3-hydroxyacyl-ACP dehydratase FabZ [Marinicaulis sp.]|nr:3-hydroxyacyl-ACP dehydratase FabZ [Marinicaulis sp.]NNE40025.1 3-hydroxyacyl-ACP dehydratase FabZ [Marinicaulis sp.]NNL88866.1 3-hydroxyacyl-ACP dehydratase FabZ [Marinicaulis sp.]